MVHQFLTEIGIHKFETEPVQTRKTGFQANPLSSVAVTTDSYSPLYNDNVSNGAARLLHYMITR